YFFNPINQDSKQKITAQDSLEHFITKLELYFKNVLNDNNINFEPKYYKKGNQGMVVYNPLPGLVYAAPLSREIEGITIEEDSLGLIDLYNELSLKNGIYMSGQAPNTKHVR
ncbi:MAG: hypothetical protein QXR96_03200, partial [Candidatus Woesearchaeota archaeon]